jgi:hypothetical protein
LGSLISFGSHRYLRSIGNGFAEKINGETCSYSFLVTAILFLVWSFWRRGFLGTPDIFGVVILIKRRIVGDRYLFQ